MSYLSVNSFWKYQNADVWKKSKGHPPWFKMYVHRDRDLDALPLEARLLWSELLAAATRYSNVLEADLKWLWAETRIDPEVIAEMLPLLLKGAWLSETKTPRRSRELSRKTRDDSLDLREVEVDKDGEQEQDTPEGSSVSDPSASASASLSAAREPDEDIDLGPPTNGGPPANGLEPETQTAHHDHVRSTITASLAASGQRQRQGQ